MSRKSICKKRNAELRRVLGKLSKYTREYVRDDPMHPRRFWQKQNLEHAALELVNMGACLK